MSAKRTYNKNIEIDYEYDDSPESEAALEEVIDMLMAKVLRANKDITLTPIDI